MKKMFKSTISLLLIAALLLTPLAGTTASAVGEISANDTATKVASTDSGYSYGNYILPDAVIPNPDYVPPEENVQTNNTASATVTENGRLADGVYWINNTANYKYLDTQNGGVTSGTPVVQWDYSAYINGDENVYNRNQLFKVTYIGTYQNEDYYTIRPMTNSGLGLAAPTSASSDLVDVKTMSTTETFANIPWYQKWVIKVDLPADGAFIGTYTIENRYVDENVFLTANRNNVNGTQITMDLGAANGAPDSTQMWQFHPYTGPDIDGVGMTKFTTGVAKGKYFRYEAFAYSSTIGRNGPVTFSVTDMDGNATDKATISSRILRGLEMGEVQLRTTYSGAPWLWLWNVDIQFEEGTYMFFNKYTGSYMHSGSYSNGFLIERDFDGTNNQKWGLTYDVSSGFYKIKNLNTDLYLTAATTSNTGTNITEQTYSTSTADRQLWKFTKTSTGAYKVQPRAYEWENCFLSTDLSDYEDEWSDLIIKQEWYYDDDNYRDEWLVVKVHSLNINSRYDQAFETYMAGNLEQNFIYDVQNKVIDALSPYLMVDFVGMELSDIVKVASDMDTHTGECDSICGTLCKNHHKNVLNLSNDIYYNRDSNTIYVSWTKNNNDICNGESEHNLLLNGVSGLVIIDEETRLLRPVINIVKPSDGFHDDTVCSTITLIHEIAHTLGVWEQYELTEYDTSPCHAGDTSTYDCVMMRYDLEKVEEFYYKIVNNDANPFCDQCMKKLVEGIANSTFDAAD
ncbi:MAG: RICIN domain-containing protein [Clostridia bacterium]|nr:RICIN domain-containing protein [Clostridia bacterium]